MIRKTHWRLRLLRWHRRVGVVAAAFVLMLVVTGILINHSHALGFDQEPLESPFWRHVYGLPAGEPGQGGGVHLGDHVLSAHDGKLYLDAQALADCARLLGTIEKSGQVLAVCPKLLVLLTKDGQLIDQADSLRGVPDGLSGVHRQGDLVVLQNSKSNYSVDLNDLSVHDLQHVGASLGTPDVTSPSIGAVDSRAAPEVTRERLLEDIHSGRILGPWGPWLVDAAALLFAVLAVSGLFLARRRHHY